METKLYYITADERARFIAASEAKGLTMLHDDFNVGPSGEHCLTFAAVVATVNPKTARLKVLLSKVADDTATLAELRELIRLERNLD